MFPSDGFIFHPIFNDRQDQTRCSGPVRASDRAEPYVCCREEGAGPSLNVRHPSWFTTTSREAQLVASSWRAAAASSSSRDVPSSYLQHPPLRFQAISNPVAHRQQDTAQGQISFTGTWNKGATPTPKSRFFPLAGSPETRSGPLPFVQLWNGGIHSTHGFGPVVSPLLALNLLSFLPPPNFSLITIQ